MRGRERTAKDARLAEGVSVTPTKKLTQREAQKAQRQDTVSRLVSHETPAPAHHQPVRPAYNGYPDPDHHAARLARARAVAAAWAATVPAGVDVLDALRRDDVRAPGGPVDVMTEMLTGNDTRSDDTCVLDDVAEASTDVGALLAEALQAVRS